MHAHCHPDGPLELVVVEDGVGPAHVRKVLRDKEGGSRSAGLDLEGDNMAVVICERDATNKISEEHPSLEGQILALPMLRSVQAAHLMLRKHRAQRT